MNFLKKLSVFEELRKFFSELSLVTSISGKLFFVATTTGLVVGLAIISFNFILEWTIKFFNYTISTLPSPPFIILMPALGGLFAGLIRYFSRTSFSYGCGTDALIEAIHKNDGHIKKITPIAGILSASMTIASGGSCGREGPASSIGAGFASITVYLIKRLRLDSLFGISLTKQDERIMAICGAAAGVGAIFRAPIGAAIFSVEVLYRYGFEFTALFPALLSSIIGFTLFSSFYSYEALFKMEAVWSFGFSTILVTIVLSIISSVVGWFYIYVFEGVLHFFRRLKIPDWIKPAIGGLVHGLLIYFVARELWGIGYETIQGTIEGRLSIAVMVLLLFGKIFSTSLSIASGGSGGLIAPSLFIGAMLGGIVGKSLGLIFTTHIPIGVYVVIGMGALFSAVGKVPFALPLLIMEATRNMSIMLPLFIASTIGYILSGKSTLYPTQPLRIDLSEIGINVLGETEGSFIEKYRVKDVMIKNDSAIHQYASLKDIAKFIQNSKETFYPVVDDSHNLFGTISFSKIKYIFSPERFNQILSASDLAVEASSQISYESNLKDALNLFNNNNSDYLPVVSADNSNRFAGILSKSDVMNILKKEMVKKAFKFGILRKHGNGGLERDTEGSADKGVKKRIYQLLDRNIILDIEADNKIDTIREMIDFLFNLGKIKDKEVTIRLFLEREKSATTGLGNGIAFPHVRAKYISSEILVLGRSSKGIEYNSIDRAPVYFVFMILTPRDRGDIMLKMMSTISGMLKYDGFKRGLIKAENVDTTIALFKEWEEKYIKDS